MDLRTKSRLYADVSVSNKCLQGNTKQESLVYRIFDSNDIERAHYDGGMWVINQLEPVLMYSGNKDDVVLRQIKEVVKSLMKNPFKL